MSEERIDSIIKTLTNVIGNNTIRLKRLEKQLKEHQAHSVCQVEVLATEFRTLIKEYDQLRQNTFGIMYEIGKDRDRLDIIEQKLGIAKEKKVFVPRVVISKKEDE